MNGRVRELYLLTYQGQIKGLAGTQIEVSKARVWKSSSGSVDDMFQLYQGPLGEWGAIRAVSLK